MLTAQQVYNQSMADIFGIENPGAALRSVKDLVLLTINAVRKELFLSNPESTIIKARTGVGLLPPTQINVTVVQNATTITGAGLATWMDGATVNVGGDPNQNRMYRTALSTYTLEAPYQGSSGVVTATVMNDTVILDPSVISVDRPVDIENQYELIPYNNQAQLRGSSWNLGTTSTDYGRIGMDAIPGGYPSVAGQRQTATPFFYITETAQLYTGGTAIRLRMDPMPDTNYVLRWWQRKLPPDVASATDVASVLVPAGMDESIFLPKVRLLLSDHPLYTGDVKRLINSAGRADAVLKNITNDQPREWDYDLKAGF